MSSALSGMAPRRSARDGEAFAEFLQVEALRLRDPRSLKPLHQRVGSAKVASLGEIVPTLRVEVLLGLQDSARLGRQVPPHIVVSALRALEMRRARSVLEVTALHEIRNAPVRDFIRTAREAVRLVSADPESESGKDVWDLRVFGRVGRLDFTAVAPGWLRAGAKRWALEKMGSCTSPVPHSCHRVS